MNTLTSSAKGALLRARSVFSLRPGKLETAGDHSRERYRRAALTGAASFLNRVISVAASILTVRLTFQYLGAERYGMWITILAVFGMFGSADLGMANGLVNLVADSLGRGDRLAAKQAIASTFWMLAGIGGLLSVGMLAVYPFLNFGRLFNVQSPLAVREAGPTLLVIVLCFVINLPLGAVRGAQTGMQNAFRNNLWSIFGVVLSLAALLAAIHLRAGLTGLALALLAAPILAIVLNGIEFFAISQPDLRPSFRFISRDSSARVLRTGLMFFLLQVSFAVGMQTDNVVIAQIMGAKAVADYAIPARLFNMTTTFLVLVSTSMWPAYTDALARSDGLWIRRAFSRVVLLGTSVTVVVTSFFVIFGNKILAIWVGPQIHASLPLLAAFALQSVLFAYLQPVGTLLNGIGRFKVQVVDGLIMAVVNLGLSIFLVRRYGIIGAVLGTAIAVVLVQVIPLTITTRRALSGLGRRPVAEGHAEGTGET